MIYRLIDKINLNLIIFWFFLTLTLDTSRYYFDPIKMQVQTKIALV